jgi:hypothetical protein
LQSQISSSCMLRERFHAGINTIAPACHIHIVMVRIITAPPGTGDWLVSSATFSDDMAYRYVLERVLKPGGGRCIPIEEVACAVTVSTIAELASASGMKLLNPGLPVQCKTGHLYAAWFVPAGTAADFHHVFLVPGGRLASFMAMKQAMGKNMSLVKHMSGAAPSPPSIVVHVDKDVPGHPWVMTSVQGAERLLECAVQASVVAEVKSFSLIPPPDR